MMFSKIHTFMFGICIVACSSSQFSSKDSSTDQNGSDSAKKDEKVVNSGRTDQTLNGEGKGENYRGPPPSLARDKIDKIVWFGCCPSYMMTSKEIAKDADRSKINWAAKAYSKVERFSFERIDQTEYKLEKTMFGHYEDSNCKIPLSEAKIATYKLKPLPKGTNVSSAVKLFEIAKDGTTADGLHTIRDTRGGSVALIDQKVRYAIEGKQLTEVITLDSKSFVDYEGYQIHCTLYPLSSKNSP